ncbi:hypothetical protein [Alkaliphilus sp. B6464]|uniref:hypothetical protein n=1 Tax=Alkaliphilus sp. B6464 TaxID=2731219 RepID=UPI001BAE4AC0|nr:hypothetical protein [Alkaliphilus sp. B6464]QUH21817.1 hypothetical protein HYG84_17935 [Alkaliphilus sp. B6464]
MKFTYDEFKKLMEDENVEEITISPQGQIYVTFLEDYEMMGKIHYKSPIKRLLSDFELVGIEEGRVIVENLVGMFDLSKEYLIMTKKTKSEVFCLIHPHGHQAGWSIYYGKL